MLGPVLFHVFVADMDSGMECIISRFADNTKLIGAVGTLEGKDAIWRDLDSLERWVKHIPLRDGFGWEDGEVVTK